MPDALRFRRSVAIKGVAEYIHVVLKQSSADSFLEMAFIIGGAVIIAFSFAAL
jgi:hypothetical protein